MAKHAKASTREKSSRQASDALTDLASCSTQDCTGLIPSGLDSEAELEAYEELYPFLPRPSEKPDTPM